MPTQRQVRVANRLQEEIARILLQEIDDPRVRLVTVTDVEVSPDLKHARVWFSVMDAAGEPADVLKGLRRGRKFIQRCLAEQADLRYTPTLEFRFDSTAQRAQRVETILHSLAESGELGADETDDGEPVEGTDEQASADETV